MLGTAIHDPVGIEGAPGASVAGLVVLEVKTTFGAEKVLALPSGTALGAKASGYEIHHGVVEGAAGDFLGGSRVGNVFATMWHGSLESDGFRQAFLAEVAAAVGRTRRPSGIEFGRARESRIDLLADLIERHLDVEALLGVDRARCSRRAAHPRTGGLAMRVLLLGGTAEARELAHLLVEAGVEVTSSLAGRVARPRLPVARFGSVDSAGWTASATGSSSTTSMPSSMPLIPLRKG